MMSKVVGAGMVTALVLAGGVVTAVPAQATSAPSCVSRQTWTSWSWKYARATNHCNGPQRFKFMWNNAFDGTCLYYAVNDQHTEDRGPQSRFDGLQNC
jgi:hypothetical protein